MTLKFSHNEFIYMTALVLLAAWRKSLPPGVQVVVDDSECAKPTQYFLTNTGFREIIDTGHETPSVQKRIGRVPLQPIANQFTKEATVTDIVSIFDDYAHHVEDMNPFRVMISELCENVLAHSESTSPGYVCARVIETSQRRRAEIAIADSGIGVRGSYLSGSNEDVKIRIKKGGSPLEIALQGLNSSKRQANPDTLRSHYGFGLLVVRRLIEENRGQMQIVSGPDSLRVDRFGGTITDLDKPFTGTFVGIVLDLDNPLPLAEIYEETENRYVPNGVRADAVEPSATAMPGEDKGHQIDSRSGRNSGPEGAPDVPVVATSETPIKRIELRHYGTELLTRDAGTAIRADIASWLAGGANVVVSLDDVTDITPSLADEAFAKLAETMGFAIFESRVRIEGGTQLAQRLVRFVLTTRRRMST